MNPDQIAESIRVALLGLKPGDVVVLKYPPERVPHDEAQRFASFLSKQIGAQALAVPDIFDLGLLRLTAEDMERLAHPEAQR